MTTTITTLALNLLVSERISHRNFLATKILTMINGLNENSEKEIEIKEAFSTVLHQCIANPTCQYRDLFYQYAEYYGKKFASLESLSYAA